MTVRRSGIPGNGSWLPSAAALALIGLAWAASAADGSTRKASFRPPAHTAPVSIVTPESSLPVQFNRDIRPILSDNCFTCHGSDSNRRMGGLRLDRADSPFKKLLSGHFAIVPGSPETSEILARVTAKDATVMPPPSTGKHLTPAEVSTLRRWIAQGAKYEEHWAYIKP
ncbi:MAG: hypothetical protein M3Y56_16610, partial [Armatimonadota bacterium]|nr:hypothetical protein [Armatimonadota bacterium]